MNAMLKGTAGAWIGLSDILADGTFNWLDGSDLEFTKSKLPTFITVSVLLYTTQLTVC